MPMGGHFSISIHRWQWLILVSALVMLLSLQAVAQTSNNALRGLSQMDLVIETPGVESSQCGITKEIIRNAVLYPVSSTKLEIKENTLPLPYLHVGFVTLFFQRRDFCVTYVALEVYSVQPMTLDASDRDILAIIQLWEAGTLGSSQRVKHAQEMTEWIEVLTKKLITDWNLDNRAH
jgi:hypothetical protein